MKRQPYIAAGRTKAIWWRSPSLRWSCVYGIPTGGPGPKITYDSGIGFGFTRRSAVRDARRGAGYKAQLRRREAS